MFKNSSDLVELLLKHGADVHFRSKGATSLLNLAVSYPDALPIVKELINAGLEINEEPPETFVKSMFTAAASGQTEMLEFLLDNGATYPPGDAGGLSTVELLKLSTSNEAGVAQVIKFLRRRGLLQDEL